MLELRNASRVYRVGEIEVVALDNVSLKVSEGEFVAILGPSGSGKSTLLNLAGLMDNPTAGQVFFDGQDVSRLSGSARSRLRLTSLGFIFQRFHLIAAFTAAENVAIPMEALGVPAGERYRRAVQLMQEVGLGERVDFVPARLSGGQRQRVAICRALANEPKLVLADEPTGQLHSEDKQQIIDLFHQLNARGNTFVVVTHDPEMAKAAHRVIELRDGRISKEVRQ